MKRDPSIHVRRSSLIEALENLVQEDPVIIVNDLFHKLNKHAIRNRVIVQPNAKTKKKMKRVVSVDKDLAEAFNVIYQQVNMQNNIKTSTITPTDARYTTLKEVAKQAQEFCGMFSLEQSFGFQTYVNIAIKKARNNYSIYRVKGLVDQIIQYYKDALDITKDKDKSGTLAFYAAWKDVSIKYLGYVSAVEDPHLYVHFIRGRIAADQKDAGYVDWISAQYEGLAEYNTTPELNQFYTDNAALRYNKYMGLKAKEYDTKDEQKYFEEGKVKVKAPQRRQGKDKKKV